MSTLTAIGTRRCVLPFLALRCAHGHQRLFRRLSAHRVASAMTGAAEPGPGTLEAHRERSWNFFRGIGSPAFHVAPMVDQVGIRSKKDCCVLN